MLTDYVLEGGRMLLEGYNLRQLAPFSGIAGFKEEMSCSEYLTASYWQFEEAGTDLQQDAGFPPLLPYRGQTAYLRPKNGADILATLVPPFAPLHAVGAPPERASMLVEKTDLPLAVLHRAGRGQVLTLPFMLSELVKDYRMAEHSALARGLIHKLLGNALTFTTEPVNGLQMTVYQKETALLVHLVNGIGQRPLMHNIPCHDVTFSIRVPEGKRVREVHMALTGEDVQTRQEGSWLHVTVKRLDFWDMAVITLE